MTDTHMRHLIDNTRTYVPTVGTQRSYPMSAAVGRRGWRGPPLAEAPRRPAGGKTGRRIPISPLPLPIFSQTVCLSEFFVFAKTAPTDFGIAAGAADVHDQVLQHRSERFPAGDQAGGKLHDPAW